ncbi:hypothetical protein [Microbacterium sp. Clip185]|uniref:hypothetical protein n=1 Tax=Microbacterium sp. Clip185 TaxID=3025663 RepID=UPI002365D5C6|nr:hypothetical protein [Microbacterium sp. Clip185]WDG17498.1 hypothetical protein PQV94_12830 [Microbacterium sp. Clip185]
MIRTLARLGAGRTAATLVVIAGVTSLGAGAAVGLARPAASASPVGVSPLRVEGPAFSGGESAPGHCIGAASNSPVWIGADVDAAPQAGCRGVQWHEPRIWR